MKKQIEFAGLADDEQIIGVVYERVGHRMLVEGTRRRTAAPVRARRREAVPEGCRGQPRGRRERDPPPPARMKAVFLALVIGTMGGALLVLLMGEGIYEPAGRSPVGPSPEVAQSEVDSKVQQAEDRARQAEVRAHLAEGEALANQQAANELLDLRRKIDEDFAYFTAELTAQYEAHVEREAQTTAHYESVLAARSDEISMLFSHAEFDHGLQNNSAAASYRIIDRFGIHLWPFVASVQYVQRECRTSWAFMCAEGPDTVVLHGWTEGDAVSSFVHEMGHLLHHQVGYPSPDSWVDHCQSIGLTWMAENDDPDLLEYVGADAAGRYVYACANELEYTAEAFKLYVLEGPDAIPPQAREWIDGLVADW